MSLNWVIETHKSVQSTQDILIGMASMGQPEGQVIHALEQVHGRGRHGRSWESLSGNLFLSALFRPACQAQDIGQLSLIAGLSLVQSVERFIDMNEDVELSLKWPNDVLLNGEKCAGLLLETELSHGGAVDWAVLGLGVNIAEAPRGLGAALQDFNDKDIELNAFRDHFLKVMANNYGHWLQFGFKDLREQWMKRAHKVGTMMNVKIGPQLVNGVFHDIDPYGNLRLRDAQHRLKTITSGEVYLY